MNYSQDRSEEVLITLRKIIRAIDLHSRYLVKHYGLTGPQLIILKELSRSNGISIREIANKVSLSQATVTNILDRLEAKGFVLKERSNSDKRRVIVKITEKSMDIIRKKPSLLQEQFVAEFKKLQDWEQTSILSSIQRIASMMNAKDFGAHPVLVSGPLVATEKEVDNFLAKETDLEKNNNKY